ncbi:Methyl-accepting chemotaxis protein [Desulfuromusa kysingii]|uniref:Methyl-accepting chemotaxis protein n=2 Tax=Desulfuromusa kysingii TaxID=37625 RepID=A0A1H4C1T9_9BACT|nr:Methyl-accepting chemotaxis protein [Desulfuromusa kysingii]
MRIRSKFILPITCLVVVSVVIALIAVNMTVKGLVTQQEESFVSYANEVLSTTAKARKETIYRGIDESGKEALDMASIFSEIPDVQTAYRLAGLGNMDDENDHEMQMAREQLRKVMAPYIAGYKKQTGNPTLNVHFHTPNGRSLVRLWRDGWQTVRNGKKIDISDDLTTFRKTVLLINDGDHKPLSGIEIGRSGFAIRGLSAVSNHSGDHLGSCEVLVSFGDVLEANHVNNDYQIAVYMLSDLLPIATKLQDPKKNPVLDDKYVFTSSTDKNITDSVLTSALLDSGRNQESQKAVGNQFVSTFPITDFSGKTVGVAALVYDMSKLTSLIAGVHESGTKSMSSINWSFGAGALVLVMILFATIFYVTRIVIGPLQMAVDAAQRIALGDLSESIDYQSKDEVGVLSDAINKMTDSLKIKAEEATQIAQGNLQVQVLVASDQDTMGKAFQNMVVNLNEVLGEVHRASDQIDSGSVQVSDTAQTLSQGATESAASLEEISSSMNEIGSQTQQSAENAGAASTLATGAQDAARAGSERMGEMVAAMTEINVAGQNISKIIKVIDEIAFQTNLLALNAAVEAARAGQHGKGFAVVAEEVRNLAARSAKAAEETAQLIEGSVEKTKNGAEIAEKTSEALDGIVTSITKVTDLVAEIAVASNEQAQGISQINQGLGQIDSAVQQSTATAEESAASAEELSSQSAHLKHMLSRFTLTGISQNVSPAPKVKPQLKTTPAAVPSHTTQSGWGAMEVPAGKLEIKLDDDEFGKF